MPSLHPAGRYARWEGARSRCFHNMNYINHVMKTSANQKGYYAEADTDNARSFLAAGASELRAPRYRPHQDRARWCFTMSHPTSKVRW